MSLQCFPLSFSSIQLTVWEEMLFEEFQDDDHAFYLGYWNGMILAILNLYVAQMLPVKFRLNQTYGLGGDVIRRISRWLPWPPSWISEDFSNSESLCHSGAPIKFQLNLTYGLGEDVVLRISRWPLWRLYWTSEWNDFSNSESI